MQRFLRVTLAALALAIVAPSVSSASVCDPDPYTGERSRIVEETIDGKQVLVLLPPDYATSKRRYPVLYGMQAGGSSPENTWLAAMGIVEFTAALPDERQAIVVMPFAGGGVTGLYTDWRDGSERWETFHIREVIPYVDSNYRTLAERSHRAIAGPSVGGFGAMHYAARHPNLSSRRGASPGSSTAPI